MKSWSRILKQGDLIGAGANGRVYMGLNEETGGLIAVKEMTFSLHEESKIKSLGEY